MSTDGVLRVVWLSGAAVMALLLLFFAVVMVWYRPAGVSLQPARTFMFRDAGTGEELERFVDREAGAVCWVMRGAAGQRRTSGVFCISCAELPREGVCGR